jgi:hypothetical protein
MQRSITRLTCLSPLERMPRITGNGHTSDHVRPSVSALQRAVAGVTAVGPESTSPVSPVTVLGGRGAHEASLMRESRWRPDSRMSRRACAARGTCWRETRSCADWPPRVARSCSRSPGGDGRSWDGNPHSVNVDPRPSSLFKSCRQGLALRLRPRERGHEDTKDVDQPNDRRRRTYSSEGSNQPTREQRPRRSDVARDIEDEGNR